MITDQTDEDPTTLEDKKELESDLKIEGWDDETHEKFTISRLIECALNFVKNEEYKTLKLEEGVNNKYIGELIESKFKKYCRGKGLMIQEEVSKGVDIPEYHTDIKYLRSDTPGHGAEFKNYEELIIGLSYDIILFRYNLDKENKIVEIK